jgi:hypothetical protein
MCYNQPTYDQPEWYEIRLRGHLDPQWAGRFDGLAIFYEETGETILRGPVADQAALHGVLRKVRDVGIPLVSVINIKATS